MSDMKKLKWTDVERDYPAVNLFVDDDGEAECPRCHGLGSERRRNYATMSPSDDFDVACHVCGGEGRVEIIDDRYGDSPAA
ncbi:hypothetical protein [Nitrospirillum amazonense]|uniref:hypothetical protein n=1 Tax=Nitrospirillum amazonense TaxID=28077 RepID=UPI002412AE32|nr:hypothetical protein [Nitrospirillum amazonense]MDG3444597.1 hypothetical protein [Nitrospirillum amazonense]